MSQWDWKISHAMTLSHGMAIIFIVLSSCSNPKKPIVIEEVSLGVETKSTYPEYLREWKLFKGNMKDMAPEDGVIPYGINSPLFTDYAHKARFIKLPEGEEIGYHPTEVLTFPIGTILVKNFFYPKDFSEPEENIRIMETRLLIHEKEEWETIVYQWNKEQTEARLLILGAEVPLEWTDEKGTLQRINYSIPSQPQCKSCHEFNGEITPIGPSARQLNRDGQLEKWREEGKLKVADSRKFPKLISYFNESETINDRARAWLEINCSHCHRREGPAKNSGLYLLTSQTDEYRLGINKAPIAAGKGSGGLRYSIVPGQSDQSILVHRIESLEPGEMMPELGRKMKHKEGIALIREWIEGMGN